MMRNRIFPDDYDQLPEGSVVDGALQEEDRTDIADYVVIGSGAGGATAAYTLSSEGYSVILLEEGPWVRTREFGVDVHPALGKMFRESASSTTVGKAPFTVLQGRCVGGGTTVNSAIAIRPHERVLDRWSYHYKLGNTISMSDLEEQFDYLDQTLTVTPVRESALGENNRIFGEAAAKRGILAERIRRYDAGCEATASCLTGCRSGKKLGMNITYVPKSLHAGARIYTSTRADKVKSRYGRVTSVLATFLSENRSSLRVVARRGVVVAASAVQSPNFLRRSGVRSNALGRYFQAHPGTTVAGRFDRSIAMDRGATQGYNSTHFVDSDRFKIESISFPPEMLGIRLPGAGAEFTDRILDYRSIVNSAITVRSEAEGRVRSFFGKDLVFYQPTPTDMARLRKGLKVLSEMLFAAGAKEVWPSVYGIPTLYSTDDLRFWDQAPLDPRAYSLMISHLFGGARMGPDSRTSVVGLDFQVHDLRGLYVLDSSVFPTNLGVNPQHTIMAVSRLATSRIVERPLPLGVGE